MPVDELLAQAKAGSRRAVARLLTRVERNEETAREVVEALYADTGRAHVVGVTGAPGSGKSSLVNELAQAFRRRDMQVGIVAVDPSSPFTGGALLGDRIRMRDLAGDTGIFIRSTASRGSLGGLSRATAAMVKVLDAAGFDVILVETVGAGQAEVDIARMAHTTVVVEAPGMGDEVQSIKAGILEIADLLVLNKADRPGAASAVKALRLMLHMGQGASLRHHGRRLSSAGGDERARASDNDGADGEGGWEIRLYETVATEGKGVEEVVDVILAHRDYLKASGEWQEREKDRSRQEMAQLLQARLMEQLEQQVAPAERERLIEAVASREVDPYTAVSRLFDRITLQG
ncbi:MAG: methylmalonyl Co-A mutase-associated GTPase MeaB [Candidatus Promineifilaceae bacterium]|nr:methylmalonyl Co-A mutase-associated GTPase MeaB [Candidatus Promineifilaceae bacterium]